MLCRITGLSLLLGFIFPALVPGATVAVTSSGLIRSHAHDSTADGVRATQKQAEDPEPAKHPEGSHAGGLFKLATAPLEVVHAWKNSVSSDVLLNGIVIILIFFAVAAAAMAIVEQELTNRTDTQKGMHSQRQTYLETARDVGKLLECWLRDPATRSRARGILIFQGLWQCYREALPAFFTSAVQADFTNQISTLHEHHDVSRVYSTLLFLLFVEILVELPTMQVLNPLVSYYSEIQLRNYLTGKALDSYLNGGGHAFYHVKLNEGTTGIDNPDQRISDDTSSVAKLSLDLYLRILGAIFGFNFWIAVIFQVGGSRVLGMAMICMALRSAVAYLGFGSGLVVTQQTVLRQGAELRYGLTRIRDSAEEIALGGGDAREHARANVLYDSLVGAIWRNLLVNMRFNIANGFASQIPGIALWLICISLMLSRGMKLGDAHRVHMAFQNVSSLLSFPVDNFSLVTNWQANAERLNVLLQACDEANSAAKKSKSNAPQAASSHGGDSGQPPDSDQGTTSHFQFVPMSLGVSHEGDIKNKSHIAMNDVSPHAALEIKNLVVAVPGLDTQDASGLSLICPRKQGLLIMGPSGIGKTSLLRTIAGLWTSGSGVVHRPARSSLHLLPNKCYLPIGNLHQLVTYPEQNCQAEAETADFSQHAVKEALGRAQLGYLAEKWGFQVDRDWRALLSTGEQQRLGFARLFWHLGASSDNSVLAVLDEATSALDVETERVLYEALKHELQEGGSLRGFVSVGHRPALRAFHQSWLLIGQDLPEEAHGEVLASGTWLAPGGKLIPWSQLSA
eukprot:TRINITY_DN34358_c0_g1_i1.p1 TRINITY_DN34358_c0_g1~~TRINITY_DN34358_c0_g1_i1.p1  ORF type:complete len:803 (+),score=112.73 TRINITY_DN34358_c0_g1_i1:33-2411(+)